MAVISAICRGVISTGPWPIETEIVSPGYHLNPRTFWLHSWPGTSPFFSPLISMPVSFSRPKIRA